LKQQHYDRKQKIRRFTMKKFSVGIGAFIALFLAIGLCADMAEAQVPDLTIWNGKWMKMSVKASKGLLFNGADSTSGPIGKVGGGGTYYACATNDALSDAVNLTIYESVDRLAVLVGTGSIQWDVGSNTYWAGLADFAIDVVALDPNIYVGAAVIVQGTLDGATLKSGKLQSMGGYGRGDDFNTGGDYGVFGASLKGTVTTKLPFSPVPACP
jgi:hypothetical protein